jgi:hypothetical protein
MRNNHSTMRVRWRLPSAVLTGLAFLAITSCGAREAVDTTPPVHPAAAAKSAALAYNYFFSDAVHASSTPKWNVVNTTGRKAWTLSTLAYSAPRSWVIGQNYWNGENDTLTTQPFPIPGLTQGVTLGFRLRYKLQAGDSLKVQYSTFGEGSDWTTLATYISGQNQHYPNWSLRTFALPSNTDFDARRYRVRFHFTSNASLNDWGVSIDNVYVYQQALSAPRNLVAEDLANFVLPLEWDHPADGPVPTVYYIYRATFPTGPFSKLGEADYPADSYVDEEADADTTYFYYVAANRNGYPESPPSNVDSGLIQSGE